MNDNNRIRVFLAQLRKFLPERVIYETLSSLPEDIFENEDYVSVPEFESDNEIKQFIDEYGLMDSENFIAFFMDQYMNFFNNMIDEIIEGLDEYDFSMDPVYSLMYAE